METLLYINSNIDTHTEYTKKRIADQSGNFIISGPHEYDSDHKFKAGETNTGNSLSFPSTSEHKLTDNFHVFNFGVRDFSFQSWAKFDKSSDRDKKRHVILSKWKGADNTPPNRIFRWSYVHDNKNPAKSYLGFEYGGPNGFANEEFPTLSLVGSDSHDGKFQLIKNGHVENSVFDANHVWERTSDTGESIDNPDLLIMKKRTDPTRYDRIGKTNNEKFTDGNLIEDTSFIKDWQTRILENNITAKICETDSKIDVSIKANTIQDSDVIVTIKSNSGFEQAKRIRNVGVGLYETTLNLNKNGKISGSEYDIKLVDVFITTPGGNWKSRFINFREKQNFDCDDMEIMTDYDWKTDIKSPLSVTSPDHVGVSYFINSKKIEASKGTYRISFLYDIDGPLDEALASEYDFSVYVLNSLDNIPTNSDGVIPTTDIVVKKTLTSEDLIVGTNSIQFDISEQLDLYVVLINSTKEQSTESTITALSLRLLEINNGIDPLDFYIVKPSISSKITAKICETDSKIDVSIKANTIQDSDVIVTIKSNSGFEQAKRIRNVGVGLYETTLNLNKNGKISGSEYDIKLVDVFITTPGGNWKSRFINFREKQNFDCDDMEIDLNVNASYDMDSKIDVSDYVEVGHIHKLECGDLVDDNWHYLYTSAYYDHAAVGDPPSVVELGVDDKYEKGPRVKDGITPLVDYFSNSDNSVDRTIYLTSIAPYFEKSSEVAYADRLYVQDVYVGKDQSGDVNNFHGNIDTLIVSEFVVHGSSELYSEDDRVSQPACQIDAKSMSMVGTYDENTKYKINCKENLDIKTYEPTHADVETPANALEMYKKQVGSLEYLKSIWHLATPPESEDLDNWRWELKFINPPWFVDRTEEQMIAWADQEKNQEQEV